MGAVLAMRPARLLLGLALCGLLTACGSSGVKAMLVVSGAVDVYVHGSGLYEWDVCAPAAVAEALGMVVTDPINAHRTNMSLYGPAAAGPNTYLAAVSP